MQNDLSTNLLFFRFVDDVDPWTYPTPQDSIKTPGALLSPCIFQPEWSAPSAFLRPEPLSGLLSASRLPGLAMTSARPLDLLQGSAPRGAFVRRGREWFRAHQLGPGHPGRSRVQELWLANGKTLVKALNVSKCTVYGVLIKILLYTDSFGWFLSFVSKGQYRAIAT